MKQEQMELVHPGFELTYKAVTSFPFQSAVARIGTTPTDGTTAFRIKKLVKQIETQREKISKEYKNELMEKFAKRDEKGEFKAETFEPQDELRAEFEKAQEEFGLRTFKVSRPQLTKHDLRDVKMTAQDMEALEGLLDEASFDGPPAPPNIASIR